VAEDLTGITKLQVSRWAKRLKDETKRDHYRAILFGAAWKKAMGDLTDDSTLVQQALSNEHYTPEKYLGAAREVLGGIDLDPASCAEANKMVKAKRFLASADNGLIRDWHGRVWLNPPYTLSGRFVAKLVEEMARSRVMAAIVLVNAHCTDTKWFDPLWDGVLCFTDHRIDFYGDDKRSGSTHGSVFAYFGPDKEAFAERFSEFGAVVARFSP
jgi:ParB family chromosome partitioning protein